MKHPSYSRANNQYSQRANVRPSQEKREALRQRMIEFNQRVKMLEEKKLLEAVA